MVARGVRHGAHLHTMDHLVSPPAAQPVDPPPGDDPTVRRVDVRLRFLLPVLLPLGLFVVLRPERYGLVPNSLDPVFYTGYSLNFDDVLNAATDRHYFVTRWTAYLPVFAFDKVLGPMASRLLWRWILAALVTASLVHLGRRLGWRPVQTVAAAVLVLSSPMFLRAFLTDYVEYMVVAIGVVLVVLALRERQTVLTAVAIGVCSGAVLVANPASFVMVATCCITALVMESGGWKRRARLVVMAAVSAVGVILAGLLLFRWRYGIDNVYQPSIDFARTYEGDPDAWKSPRLDWLGHYTWIYTPALVLVAVAVITRLRRIQWRRPEKAVFVLCAVQYAWHWADQFGRNGFGLELSFYWSFVLPPFLVAMSVVVARMTDSVSPKLLLGVVAGWLLVLMVGVPHWLDLPAGWWLLPIVAVVVAVMWWSAARWSAVTLSALLVALAWAQIGAPPYDPSAYFFLNTSPRYDAIIWNPDGSGADVFDELVWFEETMDEVANDASTSFVTVGGWAPSIVGIYAPHVTGRWVMPEPATGRLAPLTLSEIRAGKRPIVAVFGPPPEVGVVVDQISAELGDPPVLLDRTDPERLGYRLIVYAMPDAARLPFTWRGDSLSIAVGAIDGTGVSATASDPLGFVTFGPYTNLAEGRYRVTLRYRSDGPPADVVGQFDVTTIAGRGVGAVAFEGTDGAAGEVSIEFDVDDPAELWEFRTSRSVSFGLTVEQIMLEAVPAAP